MRILGIDYGDARVGVAVSDPLGMAATGVRTIKNTGKKKLLAELSEVLKEYSPCLLYTSGVRCRAANPQKQHTADKR